MTLLQALQAQGAGSRKVCLAIIADGEAFINGEACTNPKQSIEDAQSVSFMFDGDLCSWLDRIVIVMHKPLGYECSAKPSHHPSILDLLPAIHLARNVQPVGRLDVDTSGLLLLTDDGQLIQQLTHPKKHVPKTYRVTTVAPINDMQLTALLQEIELNDEPRPVKALSVERTDDHCLSLVIDEGRYHQVRRMIAAVGNRVDTLSRSHIGAFVLPEDLTPGQWRSVDDAMLAQIQTTKTIPIDA